MPAVARSASQRALAVAYACAVCEPANKSIGADFTYVKVCEPANKYTNKSIGADFFAEKQVGYSGSSQIYEQPIGLPRSAVATLERSDEVCRSQSLSTPTLHYMHGEKYFVLTIKNIMNLYGPLSLLVLTSFLVFWIGLTGIFFNRRLVISILLAVELTLLSINLVFLTFAAYLDDIIGVLMALYILCVAAAESAIGLALIIIFYRARRTISVEYISLLRG
jgi:NADH-quinone oxidoreductase subunit K